MQAVILNGGFGKRLGLSSKPKPMVKLSGKTLLEYSIDNLKLSGIKDLIFLNGFMSEKIESYYGDGKKFGVNISHHAESRPMGTAGAFLEIADKLQDDFIVIYGDLLFNFDFNRLINFSKLNGGIGSIVTHPNNHPFDSDLISFDENFKIQKIFNKPHKKNFLARNDVNSAIYFLKKEIINFIPKNSQSDWIKDIFPNLLGRLYAYPSSEFIFDVGTRKRINIARKYISSKKYTLGSYHNKRRAIFIDRDGVINEEVNGVYNYNQLKIPLFSHKAIKKINNSEYLAICVTNQPGIAKGFFSIDDLNMIHAKLDTELGANGAYLDDLFFCPHHPESGWDGEKIELKKKCNCRKPMPGMFIEASNKHNLDLKNSYFISDTAKDLSVSKKIDINIVLVETGYGSLQDMNTNTKYLKAKNLYEAVKKILKNSND